MTRIEFHCFRAGSALLVTRIECNCFRTGSALVVTKIEFHWFSTGGALVVTRIEYSFGAPYVRGSLLLRVTSRLWIGWESRYSHCHVTGLRWQYQYRKCKIMTGLTLGARCPSPVWIATTTEIGQVGTISTEIGCPSPVRIVTSTEIEHVCTRTLYLLE